METLNLKETARKAGIIAIVIFVIVFAGWAAPHVWACVGHDFVTGK